MKLYFDNTEVTYFSFGKGKKTLILIPGLQTNDLPNYAGFTLSNYYKIFAKQYKVYIIDRKKDIPDGYTIQQIASDYAKAIGLLGIKKADIFGISQGGVIAQLLAINYPDLVTKLVLGVTLSRPNETTLSVLHNWIDLVQSCKYYEFIIDNIERTYSQKYLKKVKWLLPILCKLMKPKNPQKFIRLAKTLLDFNTYDQLDKIKCQVLVLGGSKDLITTGEASIEIAQKLNCQLYMYTELSHGAYDEAKDFNQRALDFLNN